MLAVTDNNDCLVVDQLLSAWDIGRNAAIWEMNVPGATVAHFERRVDEDGNEYVVRISNQATRDRFGFVPFEDEISFDEALTDCIIFEDAKHIAGNRMRIPAVDRAAYQAAWDKALADGVNPQAYVRELDVRKTFLKKLSNPNCTVRARNELEKVYSEAVEKEIGKPVRIKIDSQVGHLYIPKDRYSTFLHEGVGAFSGNAMSTSKLWVHLEPGFYFLRGWFNADRERRCFRPKSFARA
jgi:hypothetical protein